MVALGSWISFSPRLWKNSSLCSISSPLSVLGLAYPQVESLQVSPTTRLHGQRVSGLMDHRHICYLLKSSLCYKKSGLTKHLIFIFIRYLLGQVLYYVLQGTERRKNFSYIYVCVYLFRLFPFCSLLQDFEHSPLCYTVNPCCNLFLCIVVCFC